MIGWVVLDRTWLCWYTTDSVQKVAQCKLGTMFLLSTTQKAFPEGEGGREADE